MNSLNMPSGPIVVIRGKGVLLLIFQAFVVLTSYAQLDFAEIYDPGFSTVVDPRQYLDVSFEWTIPGKAQAYFNAGLTELKEGSVSKAKQNFDLALNEHPFWVAYYYRAICEKAVSRYPQALEDLQRANRLQKDNSEIHYAFGDVYERMRLLLEAERNYKRAIDINPRLFQGFYRLGNIYFKQGDIGKANRNYEQCHLINSKFAEAYVMQGVLKLSTKRKDSEALPLFNKAIEVDPSFWQGYFWRGAFKLENGDRDLCLLDWNEVIKRNPNNGLLLTLRGYLLMDLNKFEEAFNDLRKALLMYEANENEYRGEQTRLDKKIDLQLAAKYVVRYAYGLPADALMPLQKGFCLLLMGDYQTALNDLNESLKIEESASAHLLRAIAFEQVKKFDSAYYHYDKSIVLDSELTESYKKRAILRYEQGDLKGSYSDIQRLGKLQPNSILPHRLGGLIKANFKDHYGAIIELTKALKFDTLDAEIWKTRGLSRLFIRDSVGGIADLRQCLKINPNEGALFSYVVAVLVDMRDYTQALAVANELIKQYPLDDMQVRWKIRVLIASNSLAEGRKEVNRLVEYTKRTVWINPVERSDLTMLNGWLFLKEGSPKKGIIHLSKAIKEDPKNAEAYYLRGQAYLTIKDIKKAIPDYQAAAQLGFRDSEQILAKITTVD